jgi:hypothetical protein
MTQRNPPARPAAIVRPAPERVDQQVPQTSKACSQRPVYPKMQPKPAPPPMVRQTGEVKGRKR